MLLGLNIPGRDYLKEIMSVLFECALAISMARSLASEPLFTKKITWRETEGTRHHTLIYFLITQLI